jgi:hypothetical protein
MTGWWKRDPFFVRYMAREATAIFVYLYAIVLVAGLSALANGEGGVQRLARDAAASARRRLPARVPRRLRVPHVELVRDHAEDDVRPSSSAGSASQPA